MTKKLHSKITDDKDYFNKVIKMVLKDWKINKSMTGKNLAGNNTYVWMDGSNVINSNIFVHVFKSNNSGKPNGKWIVRINDDNLFGGQKKFATESEALIFAKDYMRSH